MMKIILLALSLFLTPVAWFVLTDVLYCALAFQPDLIGWPFDVWLNDWPYRGYSLKSWAIYWAAAGLPAILLARMIWDSRTWLYPRRGLYGPDDNGWATRWRLWRSGIRHTRKPF